MAAKRAAVRRGDGGRARDPDVPTRRAVHRTARTRCAVLLGQRWERGSRRGADRTDAVGADVRRAGPSSRPAARPRPIVPEGSEALGSAMNFTAFDVFVMLGARGDAHAALRVPPTRSVAASTSPTRPRGGPYCVQASIATRSDGRPRDLGGRVAGLGRDDAGRDRRGRRRRGARHVVRSRRAEHRAGRCADPTLGTVAGRCAAS